MKKAIADGTCVCLEKDEGDGYLSTGAIEKYPLSISHEKLLFVHLVKPFIVMYTFHSSYEKHGFIFILRRSIIKKLANNMN